MKDRDLSDEMIDEVYRTRIKPLKFPLLRFKYSEQLPTKPPVDEQERMKWVG